MSRRGWGYHTVNIGHAPVCNWDEAHPETGKTWRDMWGNNADDKKLNFFFYRRGIKLDSRSHYRVDRDSRNDPPPIDS